MRELPATALKDPAARRGLPRGRLAAIADGRRRPPHRADAEEYAGTRRPRLTG